MPKETSCETNQGELDATSARWRPGGVQFNTTRATLQENIVADRLVWGLKSGLYRFGKDTPGIVHSKPIEPSLDSVHEIAPARELALADGLKSAGSKQ